ncbi:RagB/SusD family nutrient uptake outer membrane protein [Maribacter sp. 2304DJ31-5]|uniref:RagB/SusD family nutrient uptake outer membrane protein n=1 Tax=Maribacter sp. 2304DJ31-5 TaxID=3386273 RepID=UPI0039BCCD82
MIKKLLIKKAFIVACLSMLFTACSDDFLNKVPLDSINSDLVFTDKALVQANLNNLLGRLPSGQYNGGSAGYGNNYMLASICDEARAKSGWIPANNVIIAGSLSPSNTAGFGNWNSSYSNIRVANDIIKGLETSPLDEEFKAGIANQARFMRAIFYFDLVRRYGGVPLVKEAQELTEDSDELFIPRSSQAESYAYISAELEAITDMLPDLSESPSGSITKQAAIALNARTLLYAGQFSAAAAAADRLITGGDNDGLDLFGANPATADEAESNLRELYLSHGGNPETILEKLFDNEIRWHQFGRGNWPLRWRSGNGGQTCPVQELVDDFQMVENGLDIENPASGYDPDFPYDGRDPRFYVNIFYHGSEGLEGIAPSQGEPFIDMEWNTTGAFIEGPGPAKNGLASITGYLVKKFADPSDGFGPERSDLSYQNIRFAEVLLIYAEAENEVNGPSAKVYDAVNRIRRRAALPDLAPGLSKDEMQEAIRQERRIELVFENHRYFDLIRWGIAEEVLNGYQPKGMRVERRPGAPSKDDVAQIFDPLQLTYTPFDVLGRQQTFPASNNLLPIPQSEIDKFPTQLEQNPGY